MAVPERHLRRQHRPLLHRRHPGRQPQRDRLGRELERLADRRLRLARGWLLRRPARQRADLQQGAERDRGADGHELARRRLGCTERPAGALGADGQREDANVDFPAVGAFDGEQRLQRLPRRRTGRFAGRDDVHLLGSVVRDKPSARRRGLRLRRQRLRSHDAGRLDVALRRGSGTRRRLRLRRGLRHRPPRRLRQRPRRHHLRRHLDRRPRRRRALLQRQQRLCRPGHARHLLPERLHARGLGAKGGCEEGRRRARELERERADALGRPPGRRLPAHARQQRPLRLPRLGPDTDRRAMAVPERHLRRQHRPLLHRRHPGRQPQRDRLGRELERLADRRLRLARGWLLRRPARQRADLQQGAERDRGADGHEPAGTRGRDRFDAADGSLCADGLRRPGERQPCLGRRNRRRRRRPVQPPPRHERRLHAYDREPDRAADRDELHRLGARQRDLLLQGHRPGRRRQRRGRVERGDGHGRARHDASDCPGQPDRDRGVRTSEPCLGCGHRQRRRRSLRRLPVDYCRLHARHSQSNRPADGDELHRQRPRARHLLLQGGRRGRVRQCWPAVEPGVGDGDRRQHAAGGLDHSAVWRLGQRHPDRGRHRHGRSGGRRRPVQARRPEPGRRGHVRPVLTRLGHARRAQRLAHADRGRPGLRTGPPLPRPRCP